MNVRILVASFLSHLMSILLNNLIHQIERIINKVVFVMILKILFDTNDISIFKENVNVI